MLFVLKFGGYSMDALADRIDGAKASVVIIGGIVQQ